MPSYFEIKFKHNFSKLHGQTSATLVACRPFKYASDLVVANIACAKEVAK